MIPSYSVDSLSFLLKEANQRFACPIQEMDEHSLQQVVAQVFEHKGLLKKDNRDLLLQWKNFNFNSVIYLNLPLHSEIYRQIKSINAYISSESFFPSGACRACEDIIHPIISHLNTCHNAFMLPLARALKALACVSKKWNHQINEVQIFHLKEYARLKSQEKLLLDTTCKKAEEAIDFIIENKLEVANLANFQDLTNELLERLLKECSTLKHLIITSDSITQLPWQCSQLETLNCRYCSFLTSLPKMPKLTTLDCVLCKQLAYLPDMPSLTTLNCALCRQLTSLPPMPSLIKLNCIECNFPQLSSELEQHLSFACSKCKQLNSLPNMPRLKKFDCAYCVKLSNLLDTFNLVNINCFKDENFTNLYNMPNLKRIVYGRCQKLSNPTKDLAESTLLEELFIRELSAFDKL